MSRSSEDSLWRGLIVLILLLAVATLRPHAPSKPNAPGYYSVCPFAPLATLIMLAMAGGVPWIRTRRHIARTDRRACAAPDRYRRLGGAAGGASLLKALLHRRIFAALRAPDRTSNALSTDL